MMVDAREHPTDYATIGASVRPLQAYLNRESRPVLQAIAIAAGSAAGRPRTGSKAKSS